MWSVARAPRARSPRAPPRSHVLLMWPSESAGFAVRRQRRGCVDSSTILLCANAIHPIVWRTLRRRAQGQGEHEPRSPGGPVFRPDVATVRFYDPFTDRQPKPGAVGVTFGADHTEKLVEDVRERLGRDARALVDHL